MAEVVSFETEQGTKVTCSVSLAKKLGHSPKAPAKKAASSKSEK